MQTLDVTAESRSVTIGGLLPHTLYVFEVSAVTIVEGPSADASATTDEAGTNTYNKVNHKHLYVHHLIIYSTKCSTELHGNTDQSI